MGTAAVCAAQARSPDRRGTAPLGPSIAPDWRTSYGPAHCVFDTNGSQVRIPKMAGPIVAGMACGT